MKTLYLLIGSLIILSSPVLAQAYTTSSKSEGIVVSYPITKANPVVGICGPAHQSIYSTVPPREDLCSQGTPSLILPETGRFSWTCEVFAKNEIITQCEAGFSGDFPGNTTKSSKDSIPNKTKEPFSDTRKEKDTTVSMPLPDPEPLQYPFPGGGPVFLRDLTLGDSGEDVRQLQKFLNNAGFKVANTGNGSKGSETTIFGPATLKALQRFQEAHAEDLVKPLNAKSGSGYFGPLTRDKIKSISENKTMKSIGDLDQETLQKKIKDLQTQIDQLKAELAKFKATE